MSYDASDAADEFCEEVLRQAIKEFTSEHLQSNCGEHPDVIDDLYAMVIRRNPHTADDRAGSSGPAPETQVPRHGKVSGFMQGHAPLRAILGLHRRVCRSSA